MYAIQNKDGWFFSGLKSYTTIFGYYSSDHPMTTHVYKRYLEDAALFGGVIVALLYMQEHGIQGRIIRVNNSNKRNNQPVMVQLLLPGQTEFSPYVEYIDNYLGGDPLRFAHAVDRLRTTGPALIKFLRSPESVHPATRENIIDNIQNLNE